MTGKRAELRREIKLPDVPEILRKRKKSGELTAEEIGERFNAVREYFGHPDDFTAPYPTLGKLLSLVFPGFDASYVKVGRKNHEPEKLRKLYFYFLSRKKDLPKLSQLQIIKKHREEIHRLFPFTSACNTDEGLMSLVRAGKRAADKLELSDMMYEVLGVSSPDHLLRGLRPNAFLSPPTRVTTAKKPPRK